MSAFYKPNRISPLVIVVAFMFASAHLFAEEQRAEKLGAGRAKVGIAVGEKSSSTGIQLLASEVHLADGAAWVRARFSAVEFPGFEPGGSGYLQITSLFDGAVQRLNAVDFDRWRKTSAYFNGDGVRIEAFGNQTDGPVVIALEELVAGYADDFGGSGAPRTICGAFDDRQLSSDPRTARMIIIRQLTGGGTSQSICTVSIIGDGNRCFLTSGDCAGALTLSSLVSAVIEFNAPLTYPNGTTLNHPPPEDQYVPDLSSVQFQANGNSDDGEDWGYFGCFTNSNTGLTPFESQGDFFTLATSIPSGDENPIQVFGHGATVPPVFRTWSFVQKIALGSLNGVAGTILEFEADATAGDSGAAVVDEATGELIGIFTNDGCGEFNGENIATSVLNSELLKAMTQPLGICIPLTFFFPNGLPDIVDPVGGTEVLIGVIGANGTEPMPGTGQFHYNAGAGWVTETMTQTVENEYVATFPSAACGTIFDYYFSVEATTGARFPDQIDNPVTTYETVAATGITVIADVNFEDATGWTLQDANVMDGGWQQGMPASNGNDNAPTDDFDGSGQCYATGLAQGVDLDGGPTRMRSPSFDLSNANNPFVSFAYWFWTDDPVSDNFTLQYSSNGGFSWTTVFTSGHQGRQWNEARFRIADLGALASNSRFRFAASDFPNNSTTEAALDAFKIIDYECASVETCLKGDVNQDTIRDGNDIAGFTAALTGAALPGSPEFCATDMDDDGQLEVGDDILMFVQCLVGDGCP